MTSSSGSCLRLCCISLGLFLAGCDTPGQTRPSKGEFEAPRPIAMRGEALFFQNALRVETTITRGRPGAPGEGGPRVSGNGRRRGPGGGGPARRMQDEDESSPVRGLRTSPLPPVTLRVKLENLSSDPLEVQVREVNSALGNFAARPEKVLLAPGQSAELDSMISQLGAVGAVIPVTLEFRAKGKTERQQVSVRTLAPPSTGE